MLPMTTSLLLLCILYNLMLPITEVTSPEIVDCMLRFSTSHNTRLKNLATIFLEDYCTPEQVAEAMKCEMHPAAVADNPLPAVDRVPE
jgi:dihydroorotase